VLRFFICLLIVIILVLVAVFLLSRGKNQEGRPYVATGTGEPPTPPPATAEATLEPTFAVTAVPTADPTPTPLPTPTVAPTPTPTAIPDSMISGVYKDAKLPDASTDGEIGISSCYVSALNDYHVMELTGWGYANLDYFDGETCGTYLVVTQMTTGHFAAYFAGNGDGISGVDHTDAVCKNPSVCDWRAYIDVSKYDPGNYSLGLVLVYKNGTKDEYRYYEFGDLQSFTVNDGEIITPVTVTDLSQN
jgi:hypothetical protein